MSAPLVNWFLSFHQCSCWKRRMGNETYSSNVICWSRNNDLFHGLVSLFPELNSFIMDSSCQAQQDALEVRDLDIFMMFYNHHPSNSSTSLTLDFVMNRPSYLLNIFCVFLWISLFPQNLANKSIFCPCRLIYSEYLYRWDNIIWNLLSLSILFFGCSSRL